MAPYLHQVSSHTLGDIRCRMTLRLSSELPLAEALGELLAHQVSGAIVICEDRLVGIITERSAARACLEADPASLMLGEASDPSPPVGHRHTDLRDAYRLLVRHGARHVLLKSDAGEPLALISETEILSALGMEHFAHLDTVGRVMSPRPQCISAEARVELAIRMMRQYNIGCIIAETGGVPVGVFTFYDLTRLLASRARIQDLSLSEVMSRNPVSVSATTSVWSASQLMQQAGIRHLLVMREGHLVGVLSEHDIVTSLEGRYVAFLREIIAEQEHELIEQRVSFAQREGEERLRRIIEASPDMIIVKDGDGHWLVSNGAGLALFGLSGCDYVGRNDEALAKLVPPQLAESLLHCAQTNAIAWSTPEGYRYIDQLPRSDGSVCHLDVIKKPVFNRDGSRQMLVVVGRDITDRVLVEKEVKAFNATLEERVARRTDELSATLAELESFSYSISHDLRAPLRAIEGFSSVVLKDHGAELDEESRDHLHRVCDAAQRMASLIDDLLDLSRHIRKPLERRPTDLSAMAWCIVRDLKGSDPSRQVNVDVAENLWAEVDPLLMRTVLENLIGNAWKFTRPRADAHIRFGARRIGPETVFYVADDGVGLDLSLATKLFTPFQRFHPASEFEGSGIGLATVQRIVRRHGGRIWAESAPGQGATFHFTLPQ